jgi:hypothetical protein
MTALDFNTHDLFFKKVASNYPIGDTKTNYSPASILPLVPIVMMLLYSCMYTIMPTSLTL